MLPPHAQPIHKDDFFTFHCLLLFWHCFSRINQIGSLAASEPKGILGKPQDLETLAVPCSTVAEITHRYLAPSDQGRNLDVLFVDVEGFEYWVLVDGLQRPDGDLRATRPRMVYYEDKMLNQVAPKDAALDREVRNLLSKRWYFTAAGDQYDNTIAIRLDVLLDAMKASC